MQSMGKLGVGKVAVMPELCEISIVPKEGKGGDDSFFVVIK